MGSYNLTEDGAGDRFEGLINAKAAIVNNSKAVRSYSRGWEPHDYLEERILCSRTCANKFDNW